MPSCFSHHRSSDIPVAPAPIPAQRRSPARSAPAARTAVVAIGIGLLSLQGGCGEPDDDSRAGAAVMSMAEPDGADPALSNVADPGRADDTVFAPPGAADDTTPAGDMAAAPDRLDPSDPSGTIAPGDSSVLDCADALPCRQTVLDGELAVTLHAADGEALDGSGAPRIDAVFEALTRDTTIAFDRTSSIVARGQVLQADALRVGLPSAPGGRDEATFRLIAGVGINGHATFAGALIGNPATLDRVTLRLGEAGRLTDVAFANVPYGAERTAAVDCAGTLPCEWRPSDGTTTITVTSATPLRWNRATRLVVSFSTASTRSLELALLPGGRVSDGAGDTLEPYGIELGGVESRDETPLVFALDAGERIGGRLVPRRAPAEGEVSLARVELPLIERRSPRAPRWRPIFLDVPLQAAPPAE